ncbi:MAG TPA: ABC transporter substrate-binding protein [Methylomirabilota bacterium]|nr:ABC transporter substrate-binding protein [Methylomirabilota bacterium]
MDRRAFVAGIAGGLLVAPLAGHAQTAGKIHRIGFLAAASSSDRRIQGFFAAFRSGLAKLGYVEGRNIAIESRWAAGRYERLPGLAAELVRLKADVIVTAAVPAIQAAKEATSTIPIIMAVVVDPVATGLVASLARPGGNITGLSAMTPELVGKQLEMLREVAPKVSRAAVLWNPANAGNPPQLRAAELAARGLGMRLQAVEARGPGEIDGAFAAMTREGAGALVVLVDVVFVDQGKRIADLAGTHRLPAVYGLTEQVSAGGLMAYAPSFQDSYRRAAAYVDKILRGAHPGDLPVEQPTQFELVINLKTAKALGLTIPPSLLGRADEVIE